LKGWRIVPTKLYYYSSANLKIMGLGKIHFPLTDVTDPKIMLLSRRT